MSLLISNLLWKMTFLMRKIPLKIAATAAAIKLIWTKLYYFYFDICNFYYGKNCKREKRIEPTPLYGVELPYLIVEWAERARGTLLLLLK